VTRCSVGVGLAKFGVAGEIVQHFGVSVESLRGDDLTQRRAGAADGDRRA